MKKAVVIAVSVVAAIGAVVMGFGIYMTNTPEYALKEMMEDVEKSGIEGLYPHLTEDARKTVETAVSVTDSVTENKLVGQIFGFLGQGDYADVLKSEIQEIQWSIKDVLRSKKRADVILTFNYEDRLAGTIELSMLREGGEWKIDGLSLPEFDEIDW